MLLSTGRAVEDDLGRFIEMLVAAEVCAPALSSAGSRAAPHSAQRGNKATLSALMDRVSHRELALQVGTLFA